tara:strand:- start:2783 stop:3133 length:351 start_codon:yes stop_codon:yes gene_type:complete
MLYYIIKIIISSFLIVLISEISKRNSFIGGLLASMPLISILAFIWLYIDTQDSEKVIALAYSIFWLVLPSLALFIMLPFLLKFGINFYISILISIGVTMICYWLMLVLLGYIGIKL